jgi:AcrR family transcriptional regulator
VPKNAPRGASRSTRIDTAEPAAAVRSAASRQAILDAARELFAAQGYTATSISEIVARAGTSVGLPYYHFGSKKQIFITLWKEFQVSQEARSRAAIGAARHAGATGKDLLLAGTRAYLQGAWEARQIVPLVLSQDTPAGFDAMVREMDRRWERQNEKLLSEYDAIMARTATALLSGALRAVCLRFPKFKDEAEAEQFIEEALVLCGGLLSALSKSGGEGEGPTRGPEY